MKITKETLKQLIKEELETVLEAPLGAAGGVDIPGELEKVRQASPERQLAVYKAKTHRARRGMADNHRRLLKLIKRLNSGMRHGAGPNELYAMLLQAEEILRNSDVLYDIMLDLKNM
jgi:hypothetical protein